MLLTKSKHKLFQYFPEHFISCLFFPYYLYPLLIHLHWTSSFNFLSFDRTINFSFGIELHSPILLIYRFLFSKIIYYCTFARMELSRSETKSFYLDQFWIFIDFSTYIIHQIMNNYHRIHGIQFCFQMFFLKIYARGNRRIGHDQWIPKYYLSLI